MSCSGTEAFGRPFLEWETKDVVKWLNAMNLTQDYSGHFTENIGISDVGDRVKILQKITTMSADLITSSPHPLNRHVHPSWRLRRHSDMAMPRFKGHSHVPFRHYNSNASLHQKSPMPVKYVTLDRPLKFRRTSAFELPSDSESPGSSRVSSPTKASASSSPMESQLHYILETDEDISRSVQAMATLRNHKKRLSRSVNGLLQEDEGLPPTMGLNRHSSENSRLVKVLREENSTLKRELETYYQRVRRLQKLEHELEKVRETCHTLEASAARKERVEAAMRIRLEKELRRAKEINMKQKADLVALRKQKPANSSLREANHNPNEGDSVARSELKRRDTMIRHLIRQNSDAAMLRERLENDLHSTKAALRQTEQQREDEGENSAMDTYNEERMHPELEAKASSMYTESIEKLKAVLSAMQNMSDKRGRLEKRLRQELKTEIQTLREGRREGAAGSGEQAGEELKQKLGEQQVEIAALEADVAKWEQKCLELVADKEMALDTAIIPRDTRISQLGHSLTEKEDSIRDLKQQRRKYTKQLAEANQRIAELETRMTSLQSIVREKDDLLQMLQQSFLELDDCSSDQESSCVCEQSPKQLQSRRLAMGSQQHLNNGLSAVPTTGKSTGEAPVPYMSKATSHHELPKIVHHTTGGVTGSHSKQLQQAVSGAQMPPSYHYLGSRPPAFKVSHSPPSTAGIGVVTSAPIHLSSAPNAFRTQSTPKVSPYSKLVVASDVSVCSAPGSVTTPPNTLQHLRGIKSKTPPPNYKISQQSVAIRRRENVGGPPDAGDSPENSRNSSIELFDALVSQMKCNGSATPSSYPAVRTNYRHQHSKSSPSNSRIHL